MPRRASRHLACRSERKQCDVRRLPEWLLDGLTAITGRDSDVEGGAIIERGECLDNHSSAGDYPTRPGGNRYVTQPNAASSHTDTCWWH